MRRYLSTLIAAFSFALGPAAPGQDSSSGVDLLYPELAHPERDAAQAIKRRDFRFIALDPARQEVPGIGQSTRLIRSYRTKFMKQRLRLFASASANFSFDLRARAYAEQYNRTLLDYLLIHPRRK